MKKIYISYLLVFSLGFTLYFYEPFVMYSSNINDLTYNIYALFKPILISFISFLIVGFTLLTIINYINKKYFPKKKLLDISTIIIFVIFLCLFINGNYLSYNLPHLDGTEIIWKNYVTENIVSTIVCLLVIIGTIFFSKKYDISYVIKKIPYICFFIILIETSGLLLIIFFGPNIFDKKIPAIPTTTNYDVVSNDKNMIILLLDAVDSVMFNEVVKNNQYESVFEDFTYYKDTTSTYVYTRDSVPFILSGKWNHNEKKFKDYSTEAMNQSKLIEQLTNNNYNINIYSNDVIWDSDNSKVISNMVRVKQQLDLKKYLNEQKKYILYKYLPFPLKPLSNIESLNFNNGRLESDKKFYRWENTIAYKNFNKKTLQKTDEKIFKFIHIEGAHLPFNLNKDVKLVSKGEGNYYDKLEASITIINRFLTQLKENNAYDNSSIIIMSDHGYALGNGHIGRQNPIFLVKGINEHHPLSYSDIPISYTDLNDLYIDLLNDKKGQELFSNIELNRKRPVIIYQYRKENKMYEYYQTGKAWDEDTMIPSGKEYISNGRTD